MKEWVLSRGSDPPAYSPLDRERGVVITGLCYIGDPDGVIVGEYWWDSSAKRYHVKVYEKPGGSRV